LLVIPIRLALGVVWLVAARLAGASSGPALIAFALGAVGLTFLAFNDPRSRFAHGEVDPLPLPSDATAAPKWRQALTAMLPSTVGVSILAAIAVAVDPTLAALLGGVCAGLGVAALFMLPRLPADLHVDPRTKILYRALPSAHAGLEADRARLG
jgi:hypothetical protein